MRILIFGLALALFALAMSGCAHVPSEPREYHPGGRLCLEEDLSLSKQEYCYKHLWGR